MAFKAAERATATMVGDRPRSAGSGDPGWPVSEDAYGLPLRSRLRLHGDSASGDSGQRTERGGWSRPGAEFLCCNHWPKVKGSRRSRLVIVGLRLLRVYLGLGTGEVFCRALDQTDLSSIWSEFLLSSTAFIVPNLEFDISAQENFLVLSDGNLRNLGEASLFLVGPFDPTIVGNISPEDTFETTKLLIGRFGMHM
jgi:hypothetical protein